MQIAQLELILNIASLGPKRGPVHTNAFSNVCAFVRLETYRLIRVHIAVFSFAYSIVHIQTLENDNRIEVSHKSCFTCNTSNYRLWLTASKHLAKFVFQSKMH